MEGSPINLEELPLASVISHTNLNSGSTEHIIRDEVQDKSLKHEDLEIDSCDIIDVSVAYENIQEFSESDIEDEMRSKKFEPPSFSLQELCRICAKPGKNMEAVFGVQQLHRKINLCLPIIVNENDSLPLKVCNFCISRLDLTYELATECQKSDILLKYMQQNQVNFTVVEDFLEVVLTQDDIEASSVQKKKKKCVKKNSNIDPAYDSETSTTMPMEYMDDTEIDVTEDTTVKEKIIRNKERLLSCQYCTQKFKDSKLIESHIAENHTFVCSLCNKSIHGKNIKILEKHLEIVHRDLKSKHVKGKQKIQETNEFKYLSVSPLKTMKQKRKLTCKKCCNDYTSLKTHICISHFVCEKCNIRFLNQDKFNNHICKPKSKFDCIDCYKSFKLKVN